MVGVLAAVALVLYALFHAIFAPASRVRSLPKGVWIVAIIVLPVVGAGLWFWLGAPRAERRASPLRPVQRGLGPDDDPEFLRRLETQRRQKAREARLSEREAELKRQERTANEQNPGGEASPKKASPHQDSDVSAGEHGAAAAGEDLEDPNGDSATDPRPGPTSPAKD